ncbi:RNA methyltransferase [Jatrophihabitans telluris]|uniref:RNA methyltransferase n=1 Tax=Jatrophihabitans telluris TaxID=2038343 RepID=A0ABY4R1E2_9ACTN|nr:RNA methyltransferase [Jatrophihabitans telluris]UQX89127.1 RNA methyltransferase [Jatrophihabitans telluris]
MSTPRPIVTIDDPDDPRLADFRALIDADVRPDRRGIVIAEGVNVVDRLLRSPYRARAILGVPGKLAALAPTLTAAPDVAVYEVDKWLLSDVVGFRVTRGVLASADRPAPVSPASVVGGGGRFVVLEGLNDFENLGSLFRNAAAFGLNGVLLDRRCADPLYRRSVRVSMGHVFSMPFAVLDDPWPQSMSVFAEADVPVLAMTPRAAAGSVFEADVRASWAVLLGAEGPGLSEQALAAASEWRRIPMSDGVDSLNVATAGAVAFAALSVGRVFGEPNAG